MYKGPEDHALWALKKGSVHASLQAYAERLFSLYGPMTLKSQWINHAIALSLLFKCLCLCVVLTVNCCSWFSRSRGLSRMTISTLLSESLLYIYIYKYKSPHVSRRACVIVEVAFTNIYCIQSSGSMFLCQMVIPCP